LRVSHVSSAKGSQPSMKIFGRKRLMGNGFASLSFNASKDACNHNKGSGKTIV
jgi:hypothetical protein